MLSMLRSPPVIEGSVVEQIEAATRIGMRASPLAHELGTTRPRIGASAPIVTGTTFVFVK